MKCDLCENPACYTCCCGTCLRRAQEEGLRRYHACLEHFTKVTLAHKHDLNADVEWVQVP